MMANLKFGRQFQAPCHRLDILDVFSQVKFVFAIFAYDHEFLASDDASSLRELRLPATWRTCTRVNSRSYGKCQNVIKINKVAAVLYIKYLVGGGNELFVVKFIDECV